MLELLDLLNNNSNALTINVNSDKDLVDVVSMISPMLIGLAALWLSYKSTKASMSTARSSALLQAEMEVATKLKYEWINSIRDLSSKFSTSVDLIISLSFRLNSILSLMEHNNKVGLSESNDKGFHENRIAVYNALFEEQKNLRSLYKKIMLYFDGGAHPRITCFAKEIATLACVERPADDTYKITTKLDELEGEFYNVINTEWESMISFPSKDK